MARLMWIGFRRRLKGRNLNCPASGWGTINFLSYDPGSRSWPPVPLANGRDISVGKMKTGER